MEALKGRNEIVSSDDLFRAMPRTAEVGGVIGNFIGKPGRLVRLFANGRVRGMSKINDVFNRRFNRCSVTVDNRGVGV